MDCDLSEKHKAQCKNLSPPIISHCPLNLYTHRTQPALSMAKETRPRFSSHTCSSTQASRAAADRRRRFTATKLARSAHVRVFVCPCAHSRVRACVFVVYSCVLSCICVRACLFCLFVRVCVCSCVFVFCVCVRTGVRARWGGGKR